MSPSARAWTPVVTDDGSFTLASPDHGEACHSRSGAWLESLERYANACRLRERALAGEVGPTFRLLDVGTGLGWNLAAALAALDGTGVALDAVSLEVDVSVFEATLALPVPARELDRWHAPVRDALGRVLAARPARDVHERIGDARVRFLAGDARATLREIPDEARFDAVFLDAFSPRADGRLWESAFLGALASRCASGAWLSTYTCSLRVRAALSAHGLRVGAGPRFGAKAQGTLASPDRDPPPLDPRAHRRLHARADALRRGA